MPTDTKTALLDSAEHAARTFGFDGFSYADLADDVGIRKASIHHHFPSKANLSVELMKRYNANFKIVFAEMGGQRILLLIDTYRKALDGGKKLCLCVSFSASRESLSPEVIKQINFFRTMMIDWLKTAFEMGNIDGSISSVQDPAKEAAAVLSLLEGAHLTARAEEDPELFEKAIELLNLRISS